MLKKIKERFQNTSIQNKLILVFVMTSCIIFAVNLYVYINMNKMLNQIEEIYAENVRINEMEETLETIQNSMTEYLKTKGTDELEQYYRSYQEFTAQINELSSVITDDETLLMERNIRNLSESYLALTSETVQAKRGRNVDKYILSYEESTKIYSYINSYIYSLNITSFRVNSENYNTLQASFRYSELLCLTILLVVTLLNVCIVIILTRTITTPMREKELLMEAHLKDAQLKYLQAQINPHFLFNTLNAGAQLAMMEGADRTNEYIQHTADFFRYNVKKNNENVTIAEEIKLIDNYIYILNVRFSGEIGYEKEIDETLLNLIIPSMVIQPVVENSVNYGIRNIDWPGKITLSLKRSGEFAYISVKDNGIGIEEDRLLKIMNRELEPSDNRNDSNGIGLANVITRLEMFFDRKDVFEIISEGENKGTLVNIRIPIKDES